MSKITAMYNMTMKKQVSMLVSFFRMLSQIY